MNGYVAPDASPGVARKARNENVAWPQAAGQAQAVALVASLLGADVASAPTQKMWRTDE
jgi:hypothetical protein